MADPDDMSDYIYSGSVNNKVVRQLITDYSHLAGTNLLCLPLSFIKELKIRLQS